MTDNEPTAAGAANKDTDRLRVAVNAQDWGLVVNLCQLMSMNWHMSDEESLVCAGIILATESPKQDTSDLATARAENQRLAEALRQSEAEVTRLRGELETWHNYSGDCPYCEGNGVVVVGWDNDVYENIEADCPYCKGTGNWRGDDEAAEASDQ